jgi:uncharacterized protein (UPF0248 family)
LLFDPSIVGSSYLTGVECDRSRKRVTEKIKSNKLMVFMYYTENESIPMGRLVGVVNGMYGNGVTKEWGITRE